MKKNTLTYKMLKINILLALCFSFNLFSAYAQVRVVHDPIACGYGFKNEKNEWVVTPQFQQLLLLEKDFYACQQGEKWGIIRSNGKKILTIQNDQISVFSPGRFLVSTSFQHDLYTEKKVGILDTNANWFLPQNFSQISKMQYNHFLLVKTIYNKNGSSYFESSIADSSGKPKFPFLEGIILNTFYKKPVSLIGTNTIGISTVSGNVRLINNLGEVITNESYDYGLVCGENYILTKNGRYSLFNAEGKKAVETSYFVDYRNYDYQNPIPCIHGTHQFAIIENGKKGMINGDWQLIIKPEYSQITPLNSDYLLYSKARYLAIHAENNKYHLLSGEGKFLFEADTIFIKGTLLPKTNYYEQNKFKVYFIFGEKINNELKFGILDDKGAVVLPSIYTSILIDNNLDALIMEKKATQPAIPIIESVSLKEQNNIKKIPLNFIQKMDDIYFYQQNQKIYPIQFLFQNKHQNITIYGYDLPENYGNYTFIRGYQSSFIINKKNNEIEKVNSIQLGNGQFPIVQTTKGVNLWHPTKARLFNKEFTQIFQQLSANNRIWVNNPNGKWLLYDTLGKMKVNIEFDAISYQWDTMIVQSDSKKGLIDINCHWIFKPIFKDMFLISKSLYVATTFTNKLAVLDIFNPNQIDTIYDSYKPMVQLVNKKQFYYCLEKGGKKYFFDEEKKPIKKTEKELITEFWMNPQNANQNFSLKLTNGNERYFNNADDIIYDYLYPFYLKNIQQGGQAVINGTKVFENQNMYQFSIEHSSYNKLSLLIYQPRRNDEYLDFGKFHAPNNRSLDYYELSNWIRVENEWKKVNFEELFNTKNKKYQEAIIEAIQNNPHLKIDCTEPNSLMEGANKFSFEKDGIKLYFFEGEARSFQLKITKEQLENIASAKWIIPFL